MVHGSRNRALFSVPLPAHRATASNARVHTPLGMSNPHPERAATELLDACWYEWGVDPSILMSLVVPVEDLERDTPFGKELVARVRKALGRRWMERLPEVVQEVQRVFSERQRLGQSPGAKGMNLTGRHGGREGDGGIVVWEGFRKAEVLEKAVKGASIGVKRCPLMLLCVAQFVRADTRRFFRVFSCPQDMVCSVSRTLCTPKSPFLSVLEAPAGPGGVLKLYLDTEYYLSGMLFLGDGCRSSRIESMVRIAEDLPAVLSGALVALDIVAKGDTRRVVVKDNSRELPSGDYKVARHLVFDILLTGSTRDVVMERLFSWIGKTAPGVLRAIQFHKGAMGAEEYGRLANKRAVCLLGVDPCSRSNLQMLRFAGTRKSAGDPVLSVLKVVSVRDGEQVSEECAVQGPSGSQPSAAELWDTCVSIPSPMCRPIMRVPVPAKRKREQVSQGPSVHVSWGALRCQWFLDFCKRACGGNLPRMMTRVPYANPPSGYEEAQVFQVNGSGINVCAMSLMQVPPPCKPHVHKSNGTVFCVLGETVLVRCMDPACSSTLSAFGGAWKLLARSQGLELSSEDRLLGSGGRGWWARLSREAAARV